MIARPQLPIDDVLPDLARALAEHARVAVQAPPGAGKSTGLPLWLLGQGATPQRRIVLLQPRRLAAAGVAAWLARQCGSPLGTDVGLRTRFDHVMSETVRIEVVTEGIFLRQIQRDPTLAGVGWVLFDEYHERSWQADLGLAFACETQQLWREPDCPLQLIVMSATLPAAAVCRWLEAPLIHAEGRSYAVAIDYVPGPAGGRDPAGGLDHAAAQIERLLAAGAAKVLVFLPGWSAIARLAARFEDRTGLDVLPLHSQVSPEQQQAALAPPRDGRQALVLATNIAETSLTIDGVDVVIDSGQVRRARFDPARGMDRLETGWISQASATQRAGRAGRQGPGRCVRLWSREQQGRLPAHDPADVQRVDLAPLALELALWQGEVTLLPELPPADRLEDARRLLRELGALDAAGRITATGRRLAGLGVHPRLGRLLQLGEEAGDPRTAALLAAMLSEGDCVRADAGTSADLDWRLQLLRDRTGQAALRAGVARRIRQLAAQLTQRLGVGKTAAGASVDPAALLYAAFPDRLARQREPGSVRYLSVEGFELQLDAGDALRQAPWLVVAEHDGARQGARIRLAAAIASADVEALTAGQQVATTEVYWDDGRGAVAGRRVRRLGAIELDSAPIPVDDTAAAGIWLTELRRHGLDWLQLPPAAAAWLARVRWYGAWLEARGDSGWPDFSDAALLADLSQWLAPYLAGVRRLTELRAVDWLGALQARLDYPSRQQLDRLAPARFELPSGQSQRIEYEAGATPRLAARVQAFYGMDRHPAIVEGRQPLLLELLSPAQRPVQLTQDLPGFWRSSYADVRKDMKGRYPKHFWPEQPWTAPATTTTRRRMQDEG